MSNLDNLCLKSLCTPRKDIFSRNTIDRETLDISELEKLDPIEFFKRNYITDGMKRLVENLLNKFNGIEPSWPITKLTQAMGGGKTHNMIALALTCKYPQFRKNIIANYNGSMTAINVVIIDGRNSHPNGIWGSIAEQLGRKELFNHLYSPLYYPGKDEWQKILKDIPTLILIDEMPFYLEAVKAKQVGDGNLATLTSSALSTLFEAVKSMNNVSLVMSTLIGSYIESNIELNKLFNTIEDELNRSAKSLTPVDSTSYDIYHILRKQLFEGTPNEMQKENIEKVAGLYRDKLEEFVSVGLTLETPEVLYKEIQYSYPFHPSLQELYSRFANNQGFQQTRGLIRLMKNVVRNVFHDNSEISSNQLLINCYDFDFSDSQTRDELMNVKFSLKNALSKDIYSENNVSTSQQIDEGNNDFSANKIAKLIYVSSLAEVLNSVIGLTESQIAAYICNPIEDVKELKNLLQKLLDRCWYLHRDGNIFYFKDQKNLTAELNEYILNSSDEIGIKVIRHEIQERFKPVLKECYQKLLVFPNVEEIYKAINKDDITLIIYKPSYDAPLNEQLNKVYADIEFKNRVFFLTCDSVQHFDELIQSAKERNAIDEIKKIYLNSKDFSNSIKSEIDRVHVDKIAKFKQRMIDCFVLIKYPAAMDALRQADFKMKFEGCDCNAEEQIINALLGSKLLDIKNFSDDIIRKRIQRDLFIVDLNTKQVKDTPWNYIKERAAKNTAFPFIKASLIEAYKSRFINEDLWRDEQGYIKVGPFKGKTRLILLQKNDTLEVKVEYCELPEIHYEIGNRIPTINSPILNEKAIRLNKNNLVMNFLCVDKSGKNEIGEVESFKAKVELQCNHDTSSQIQYVEFKSSIPEIPIYYSDDGSNIESSNKIYTGKVQIPVKGLVIAQAKYNDIYSEKKEIKYVSVVTGGGPSTSIKLNLPLTVKKYYEINDSAKVANFLNSLVACGGKVKSIDVTLTDKINSRIPYVSMSITENFVTGEILKDNLNFIQESLLKGKLVNTIIDFNELHLDTASDFDKLNIDKLYNLKNYEYEQ